MTTFETPTPISATIELARGHVHLTAGDGPATVVDVRPSDASKDDDRRAAELTRVALDDGRLVVEAPRARSWLSRGGGSVRVTIALPADSRVEGTAGDGDFHCDGRLGDCRITTGRGHIRLDQAGALTLKTGLGDVSVTRAGGHADVTTGSGDVRLVQLDDTAVVRTANGDTWVGLAAGDLRLKAANGGIAVDVARATVVARSARGAVRVGAVGGGAVVLEAQVGDLEVGIPDGTAAWLDVSTRAGAVVNALDAADAPEPSAETVEVRARTAVGNIVIRRP